MKIFVPVVPITVKHLQGQHDQASHGDRDGGGERLASTREIAAAEGAAQTALLGARRTLDERVAPEARDIAERMIDSAPATPPPPGDFYSGDPETGSRVGVPPDSVPPPPSIPQLPNLTGFERAAEELFKGEYEKDPAGMASDYNKLVESARDHEVKKLVTGPPPMSEEEARALAKPVFETDAAKQLSTLWGGPESEATATRAYARGILNTALHQTANAVTKRAFVAYLDKLKPGDKILITNGGCGAGKGFVLNENKEPPASEIAARLKREAAVIWDSAGDQNGTENAWILKEAEKRGLVVNSVYVDADPLDSWAGKYGVVARANKPSNGRMVDAQVFADSYAHGARNFRSFVDAAKGSAAFGGVTYLSNKKGKVAVLDGIPESSFHDPKALLTYAQKTIAEKRGSLRSAVVRGAMEHVRIFLTKPKAKKKAVTIYVEKATLDEQDKEGAMTQGTKPEPEPEREATGDEISAWEEAMIRALDHEDERSDAMARFVRENNLARGPKFPERLEVDPNTFEAVVNGIRESEFGKQPEQALKDTADKPKKD